MVKIGKWCVGVLLMVGISVQADVAWDDAFDTVSIWNDGFDASLNTNWTIYHNGSGSSVSQTNEQMILDTGTVAGSAQAAVNTQSNQTGSITTFNGAPLYNFYDHQVQVRFDIASMTGVPISGRTVFYLSIGEDSTGNFAPQETVLDNGVGLSIERLAGDIWRINNASFTNGVYVGGAVVGTISGVPAAITYTLVGTQLDIVLEGATFTASGLATASATVNDISANITDYHLAFGAYNRGTVEGKTVVVLDALAVSVGGMNPNWTVYHNGFGSSVSQTNEQMVLDTGVPAGAAQAAVNTLTDQTGSMTMFNGSPLYDFYDHQVKVRFDIASMTGIANGGRNVFYLSIGNDSIGNFAPQGTVLDNGVGLSIEHLAGDIWRVNNASFTNGVYVGGAVVGTISGVPAAITYTLNGTQLDIEMEGATFIVSGLATATATVKDISASITDYHLAFGAYNRGALTEKTVMTLDALTVSIGAEASSFQTWADSWGISIGSETNDYDGDLLDNLSEYGLGGDPTNALDMGQVPILGNDGGTMVYVHAQRTDDGNLSYYLETTGDLISPDWTNSGYSVVATNVTGDTFDYVTNTIPTVADKTFLRLRIENN